MTLGAASVELVPDGTQIPCATRAEFLILMGRITSSLEEIAGLVLGFSHSQHSGLSRLLSTLSFHIIVGRTTAVRAFPLVPQANDPV